MPKYRKKAIEVEAVQWDDTDVCYNTIKTMAYGKGVNINRMVKPFKGDLMVETLEGDMQASKGDFIVKGIIGELYPVKPVIFHQTYELI